MAIGSGYYCSYVRQKDSLRKELEGLLSTLPGQPGLMTATPRDMTRFLVFEDQNGRTQVHKNACSFLGQRGICAFSCPVRLSFKTVDSYIGKLRAPFFLLWDVMANGI
jgi:hypothetical protein